MKPAIVVDKINQAEIILTKIVKIADGIVVMRVQDLENCAAGVSMMS